MPRKASGTLVRDGSMLAGRHLTIANSGRSAGPSTSRRWSLRSGRGATEKPGGNIPYSGLPG